MSFRKSIFATLGLNVYSFAIGFINSIFSTRILGAEGKGVFAIYTSSIELFALILGFGIPQAMVFFAAKDTIARDRLFNSSLTYVAVATVVFTLVIFASDVFGFLSFFLPSPFTGAAFRFTLILNFACLLGWYFIASILNGHKHFPQTNLISFVSLTATFIIYGIVYVIERYGQGHFYADSFYVIQAATALLVLILTIYMHHRLVKSTRGMEFLISRTEGTQVLKYGLVYYVSNFLLFANTKMDYWFVNYLAGSYQLGLYSLSSNVALLILLMPNAFGLVLSAFKAKSDMVDVEGRTAFLCRFSFFITTLFTITLWLICEPVIVFLYGKEFSDSAQPLRIILAGVIPFTVFTILKNYFAGADNLQAFLKAALLGFIVTLTLDILLIKPFGIMGAATATAISYLVSSWYLIMLFSRQTKIPVASIIFMTSSDFLFLRNFIANRKA